MSAVDAEVVEQTDDVARQRRGGDLAVDVGRPAVALQLDADDAVLACQRRDQPREVEVDAEHAAVQKDERRTVAVDLVVHVYAVDIDVAALGHLGLPCSRLVTRRDAGCRENSSVSGVPRAYGARVRISMLWPSGSGK